MFTTYPYPYSWAREHKLAYYVYTYAHFIQSKISKWHTYFFKFLDLEDFYILYNFNNLYIFSFLILCDALYLFILLKITHTSFNVHLITIHHSWAHDRKLAYYLVVVIVPIKKIYGPLEIIHNIYFLRHHLTNNKCSVFCSQEWRLFIFIYWMIFAIWWFSRVNLSWFVMICHESKSIYINYFQEYNFEEIIIHHHHIIHSIVQLPTSLYYIRTWYHAGWYASNVKKYSYELFNGFEVWSNGNDMNWLLVYNWFIDIRVNITDIVAVRLINSADIVIW